MKINKRIGIVGKGFVGSAVQFGFSPSVGVDAEVKVYDKDPNKSTHTLQEVVLGSDIIFLSVPTPSNKDGSINLDVVESILSEINEIYVRPRSKYAKISTGNNIILLRSTVIPGTTRKLQEKYSKLRIVFNPEFLTERAANFDFINQSRFVVGGDPDDVLEVSDLFRKRFGESMSIIETNYETAELIKYMTNTFFATKISFLNDMKLLSDKCGAIWEDTIEGFVRDGRVGHTHLSVPGHDGRYGFGGSCFPKDIQALINYANDLGVDMNVLNGVWKTNLEVRPEKDWEQLKGRSIVDE
jgi:UDPglucose 6-dehydrogenase